MGANAQTSVPAFTAGQVLTAAQMTQVNTGIPVFASSTERDAAFGGTGEKTLAEGQMAYLEDTNATQYYDGSSWAAIAGGKILQVVSTNKNDVFTTTSGTFVDVTGLSVTITPSAATSKILVLSNVSTFGAPSTSAVRVQLVRDSTPISVGGSGTVASDVGANITNTTNSVANVYLDSPATTSATVYKWQIHGVSGQTVGVNRDTGGTYKTASNIVVLEVSA